MNDIQAQLNSVYENLDDDAESIDALEKRISNLDAWYTTLRDDLQRSKSQVLTLKEIINAQERRISKLEKQMMTEDDIREMILDLTLNEQEIRKIIEEKS